MIKKRTMKDNLVEVHYFGKSYIDPIALKILTSSPIAQDVIRRKGYTPESVIE